MIFFKSTPYSPCVLDREIFENIIHLMIGKCNYRAKQESTLKSKNGQIIAAHLLEKFFSMASKLVNAQGKFDTLLHIVLDRRSHHLHEMVSFLST